MTIRMTSAGLPDIFLFVWRGGGGGGYHLTPALLVRFLSSKNLIIIIKQLKGVLFHFTKCMTEESRQAGKAKLMNSALRP